MRRGRTALRERRKRAAARLEAAIAIEARWSRPDYRATWNLARMRQEYATLQGRLL